MSSTAISRAKELKTVFLVDRHALMRRAAAEWINRSSGLEVCGMTGGMADAFWAVNRLHPDLIVSEIMQPQDFGFIRKLHRKHPHLPILVFTIQDAAVCAERAKEAGACGYVMKEAGGEELVQNIRAVLCRRNGARHALAGRLGGEGSRKNQRQKH